jgi:hypothetical protein
MSKHVIGRVAVWILGRGSRPVVRGFSGRELSLENTGSVSLVSCPASSDCFDLTVLCTSRGMEFEGEHSLLWQDSVCNSHFWSNLLRLLGEKNSCPTYKVNLKGQPWREKEFHPPPQCWFWRPKADEWVSHPPWRTISFLYPEEMEACIPAS